MKASQLILAGLLLQAPVHAQTQSEPQPRAAETKEGLAAEVVSLTAAANAAAQSKDWPKMKEIAERLVAKGVNLAAAYPDDPNISGSEAGCYKLLGDAHLGLREYAEAIEAYEKASGLAQALFDSGKDIPGLGKTMSVVEISEGNAYLKAQKPKDAIACYERAARLDPTSVTTLFNICATEYNLGDSGGAAAAADRVIALDPAKADAYFIKGSSLFVNGTVGPNGKFIVSAETVAALRKYLELAPNGSHAEDVKQMLDASETSGK